MGDVADPDLSNGTCYYAENTETKGDFIPCGNVVFGQWPCCHTGDMCLGYRDGNACWDEGTGNTYLAGCTDPGFNSPVCPWKSTEFHDQEWVAIHQCDPGTGKDDTEWGGCKVSDNSTDLKRLPLASCDPYCTSTLFQGASQIPAFASLPRSASGTIVWTSDFNPTSSSASNLPNIATTPPTSQTSLKTPKNTSGTSQPEATSSSPTSTPAPETSRDSGLSTGAKAGIGIGAVMALVMIGVIILLALLVRRRKRRRDENSYNTPPEQTQVQYHGPGPQMPSPGPWSEPGLNQGAYVGFKSELPANEAHQQQSDSTFKSELPGDETYAISHISQPSPYPSSATKSQSLSPYQTYDPRSDHASTFSEASTMQISGMGHSIYVSPQSTGSLAHASGSPGPS